MKKVDLSPVDLDENDINAVLETLKTGWLAHGEQNKLFEKEFEDYLGVRKALTLNSCTSALDLALRCFNFPSGSEVIIPSFTWVSTGNVVLLNNLIPVFADISPLDFQIDPQDVLRLITKKTVAVIGVHFSGLMCDVLSLKKICEDNDLIFIEDSAECLGTSRNSIKPGTTGIGCFSFYPTKNMTTCEGGMLTTNDINIDAKCRALSAHGIKKSTFDRETINVLENKPNWYREATLNGFNFRMPNPLAALGRSQLSRLDHMVLRRREIAKSYDSSLSNFEFIHIPKYEINNDISSYQMYVFTIANTFDKVDLINKFRDLNIGASSHFDPPLHMQKAFQSYRKESLLTNTEKISNSIISLPMSSALTDEDVNMVCSAINNLLSRL